MTVVTTFGDHLFLGTDRGTAYMLQLPSPADPMPVSPLLLPVVWDEQVLRGGVSIRSLAVGTSRPQLTLVAAGQVMFLI